MMNNIKNQSPHSEKFPDTSGGKKCAEDEHQICIVSWINHMSILEIKLNDNH